MALKKSLLNFGILPIFLAPVLSYAATVALSDPTKLLAPKAENVVHKTLKHDSLHAMFADMEMQIVLPKAWKV